MKLPPPLGVVCQSFTGAPTQVLRELVLFTENVKRGSERRRRRKRKRKRRRKKSGRGLQRGRGEIHHSLPVDAFTDWISFFFPFLFSPLLTHTHTQPHSHNQVTNPLGQVVPHERLCFSSLAPKTKNKSRKSQHISNAIPQSNAILRTFFCEQYLHMQTFARPGHVRVYLAEPNAVPHRLSRLVADK